MENEQLNRLEQMMGALIKMVGENNGRLKTLEDKSDHLESRFDHLENRFDNLEERFDNLENRFDHLESRFDNLENKVDKLESDMQEVKYDMKYLLKSQERQGRIIEMLSVKSLETDSYIQEFKRRIV